MGFSVFLFGFGEEIAVDSDSQSPLPKPLHQQNPNHALAAHLLEGIVQTEEAPNAKLYVNYNYVDTGSGEVVETIILL
jgi:hypothetical protein